MITGYMTDGSGIDHREYERCEADRLGMSVSDGGFFCFLPDRGGRRGGKAFGYVSAGTSDQ